MINLLEYKSTDFKADYIFHEISEYFTIKRYLLPKLSGLYKLIFLNLNFEDTSTLLHEEQNNTLSEIYIYLKRDILNLIVLNFPEYKEKSNNLWDIYLSLLSEYPKSIHYKASKELFFRTKGNTEKIKQILSILLKSDTNHITLEDIDRLVQKIDIIYPKDVFLKSLGLRHKYRNLFDLATEVENNTNRDLLFYALRKLSVSLFKDKLKYLKNEEVHNSLVNIIDYMDVSLIYLMFQLSTPDMVYVILNEMKFLNKDFEFFKTCFLFNEEDYYVNI